MSEIINTTNPESLNENSSEKLRRRLDALSVSIPEITDTREVIEKGGASLIEEFDLKPEFFDDEAHSLFFIALAQRKGGLIGEAELGQTLDAQSKEKEFIYDAMALLALEKSNKYADFSRLVCTEESLPDEKIEEIFDSYTNIELTNEMGEAINAGFLKEVKGRLGVTAENEDKYEIRILNVGGTMAFAGMAASIPPELNDKPYNDPLVQEYYRKYNEHRLYKENLEESTVRFRSEIGMANEVPMAWKTNINGVNTIVLPAPFAEKMLHPDNYIASYTQDHFIKDKAALEHEYVHSQGGICFDEDSLIGITIEELRAEQFSENKLGYQDVKSAAHYLQLITGVDLVGEMSSKIKGGTKIEIFETLAIKIGLQRMLEYGLTPPRSYAKESLPLLFASHDHLGGLNGLIERLYADANGDDKLQTNEDGFMNEAMATKEFFSSNNYTEDALEGYLSYKSGICGMPFATSIIQAKIDELKK